MSAWQSPQVWRWTLGNYEVTLVPNLPRALWRLWRAWRRGYGIGRHMLFGVGYLYDVRCDDCRWGVRFLTLNVWEVQSTYRQRRPA